MIEVFGIVKAARPMPLEFAPDCCDAQSYVAIGEACAANFLGCWHPFRPLGAAFYFSLPFRLGLPPASLIFLNALLLLLAALVGVRAMMEISSGVTRVTRALLAVGTLGVTALFTAELVRNSLTDAPAGAFVLLSIWLLVLAGSRERSWLYGAAGAALGTSAILRAFYLYPALLAAVCLVLLLRVRREPVARVAAFCGALLVPIAIQVLATYARVGAWSFIDPASTAAGERLHFQTTWYGYDTLLPGRPFWYAAPECFPASAGMGDALRTHRWGEALCLVAHRQWFYFGSYAWGGRAYLHAPDERLFSVAFFVMNGVAIAVAGLWALLRARRARLLFVPLILLGAIWGEGSLIIPETRFFVGLHIALWVVALSGTLDLARGILARRRGAAADDDGFAWIPAALAAGVGAVRRWRPSVAVPALRRWRP